MKNSPPKLTIQRSTLSTGNIFADLGLPDAEELKTKFHLVQTLVSELRNRTSTQAEAAELLGIQQPKVSALMNYRVEGFSTDRLITLLNRLGQKVDVHVSPNDAFDTDEPTTHTYRSRKRLLPANRYRFALSVASEISPRSLLRML